MTITLKSPIDVQIEVTEACNQSCFHCYNHWRPDGGITHKPQTLTFAQIDRIVDQLAQHDVLSITITGGEPFLFPEHVFRLLDACQRHSIQPSINTNLSHVTKEMLQYLKERHPKVPLLVSLLSADPKEHERLSGSKPGSHARILELITFGVSQGLRISVNMVLLASNYTGLRKTALLAKDLGCRTFCATKALPNTYSPDDSQLLTSNQVLWALDELVAIEDDVGLKVETLGCFPKCLAIESPSFDRFAHRVCVAGKTTATIGSDGTVRACSHTAQVSGNIFNNELIEAWENMRLWRDGSYIPPTCTTCPILSQCTGGCRMNTLGNDVSGLDRHACPDKMKLFTPKHHQHPQLHDLHQIPDSVIVPIEVGFRIESFGGIMYRKDRFSIILLNTTAFAFLRGRQKGNKPFTFDLFLQSSGATTKTQISSVHNLFLRLYGKQLVIPNPQESTS